MACDNPVTQAITVDDFKTQFYRDFNFIDTWLVTTPYVVGNQVFYDVNRRFYDNILDVTGGLPTDTLNWKQITDIAGLVSDLDITNAFAEACISFNDTFFDDDDDIKLGYLYLAAHYLVNDLNAGGIDSASAGLANTRSVGNVSESYSIPQWMLDDKILSFYAQSSYGRKYLNMILPKLTGNVVAIDGCTTP